MKTLCAFILLILCFADINGQELDSLMQILENQRGLTSYNIPQNPEQTPRSADNDTIKLKVGQKEVIKVIDRTDSTYVQVGANEFIVVQEHPDSTTVRIGKRDISIIEKDNNSEINIRKNENNSSYPRRFKGHWAGFEWGFNNLLDDDFTVSREPELEYMDINSGRSWVINLNFAQYSLGFGTSFAGLVTGLGIEFNNYFFNNDITLSKVDGEIAEVDLSELNISKSKLTTAYIRMPLILEAQFPGVIRSKRAFVSVGVVGGIRLGSHTKYVYKDDDGKEKEKSKSDFYINSLRYGVTSRIGYGNTNIFFDYYFTPLFADNRGPELNPFSVGLSLAF